MNNYQSEQLNELAAALAKAQGEMLIAGKDSKNPFFKSTYADFATIVRASRPALAKYGLAVIQRVITQEDGVEVLYTMLLHSSGQYLEGRIKINPVKQDVQSMGSAITYLKRYAYAAMVGVTSADEDDDGHEASVAPRDTKAAPAPKLGDDPISLDQLSELEHELKDHPDIAEQVLVGLKINSLADMPKKMYRHSMNRIRDIIKNK